MLPGGMRRLGVFVFALLLSGMMVLSAQTAAKRISFSAQNESLTSVLSRLEKESGYYKFNYNVADVEGVQVSTSATGQTVPQIVNEALKDKGLRVQVRGKFIQILKLPTATQGVVVDEATGEPVAGATVIVKGGRVGSVTDENGRFHIPGLPRGAEQLMISFVGYVTKVVDIKDDFRVSLRESTESLEETVVVGYGSTLRKDLTGSVSTVKGEEIQNLPSVTVDDALIGKVAGVNITKSDGAPGGAVRFRIRGGASLSGSADPLYVIDGIPTEINNSYIASTVSEQVNPIEAANYGDDFNNSISGNFTRGLNNLAGLNINDIESITIMKDASATAIYGSKAANGVVIITTKRGNRDQKPTINFNYSFSVTNPVKEKLLDGQGYIDALTQSINTSIANMTDMMERDPSMAGSMQSYISSLQTRLAQLPTYGNANSDWLGAVLRTGTAHNADLSVQGGSRTSRYYTSISMSQQDGTIINTDFRRLSGKTSLDADITRRIHFASNVMYSYTKNNINSGTYSQAMSAPPILPMYNEDGSFADYSTIGGVGSDYMGFQNPLAVSESTNLARTYGIKGNIGLTIDILNDLSFKTVYSIDWSNYDQVNYTPSFVKVGGYYGASDSEGGQGSQSQSTSTNVFWENTLSYNKVFNENNRLDAVVGQSWEEQRLSFFSASGMGYPDDAFLNNLSSAAYATKVAGSNPSSTTALLSFYARLNYVLFERYLFTFTGRSDTSSKFAKDYRTGWFPSGAVAWRINQEKWLRDASWIDEIKLRASAGITGTQHISSYQFLTLFSPGDYAGSNALYPSQLGNDGIRWEETTQYDLGLDYSFFKGRLGGTVAYYFKTTDGALLSVTAAPSTGYSTYISNIAKIRNRGFEFELYGDIIRTKDWKWSGSFNLAFNRGKVLNIGGDFSDATDRRALNLGTSLVKEGESLGILCGRPTDGLIENEEQLLDYMERFAMWNYMETDLGIGSVMYKLDETGYYYEDEIGNCTPDFFGGFNTTLSWKNWALLAGFTFSYGNDLIYQKDVNDCSFSSTANRSTRVLEASSYGNYTGRPLSTFNTTYMLTDQNVYDASYLKLQSLSLSYALTPKVCKKLGLQQASIYCTGTNLFTITSYPGPDPAVSDDPYSIIGGGRDVSSYPTTKSFTVGVRVAF